MKAPMHRFWIQSDLMEGLKALSRSNSTTLYVTLLAAFKVLLFRYSSQNDLIVGSPIEARRRPELENVFGYFLDTVAIRTRPNAQVSFNEFLTQTRDTALEAFAAADVPFERVVHEVKPRRDNSHHPIFQAFFSMRPVAPSFPAGWDLSPIDIAAGDGQVRYLSGTWRTARPSRRPVSLQHRSLRLSDDAEDGKPLVQPPAGNLRASPRPVWPICRSLRRKSAR